MGRDVWCKHYRAMSEHKECKAGVSYETFKGLPFDERPCFQNCAGCEKAEYMTADEAAAHRAAMFARIEGIGRARQAIVAHLGGPWKRGTPSAQGVIDCPVCGGAQALRFTRAGYNGHVHAACTTAKCVSWME